MSFWIQPKVPMELFYNVVEALYADHDTKALADLCRVNRFLYSIAIARLYHQIAIFQRGSLRKLTRTLNEHPALFDANRELLFHDRLWDDRCQMMVQRVLSYVYGTGNLRALAYPIFHSFFSYLGNYHNFARLERLVVNAMHFNSTDDVNLLLSLPSLTQLAVAVTFVSLPPPAEAAYLSGMIRYFSNPRSPTHVVLGFNGGGQDMRRQKLLYEHVVRQCPRLGTDIIVVRAEYGPGTRTPNFSFWDHIICGSFWAVARLLEQSQNGQNAIY